MRFEPTITLGEVGLRFRSRPHVLAFEPGGRVVWAGSDHGLTGYDLTRGRVRATRVSAAVHALDVSPDEVFLGGPSDLFTFDTASGRLAPETRGYPNTVSTPPERRTVWGVSHESLCVLMSASGLVVLDLRVRWYESASVLVPNEFHGAACLSPRATRVCAWEASNLSVFRSPSGSRVAEQSVSSPVRAGVWLNEQALLLADERAVVRRVSDDLATEHWSRVCGVRPVLSLALSPDGRVCAAGGAQGVELLDTANGTVLATVPFTTTGALDMTLPQPIAVGPEGKLVARVDAHAALEVIDAETHETRVRGGLVEGEVVSVEWSHGGAVLAVAARGDPTVRVWDGATGELRDVFEVGDGPFDAYALAPDGTRYATATSAGVVQLWEVSSGVMLAEWNSAGIVRDLRWSPDGEQLAACMWGDDLHAAVCFDRALRLRWRSDLRSSLEPAFVRWSSDLARVRVVTSGSIEDRDAGTGAEVRRWAITTERALAQAEWASDERRMVILTGRGNGPAQRTGPRLIDLTFEPYRYDWVAAVACDGASAIDPTGRLCALGHKGSIHIWDLRARRRVYTRPPHSRDEHVTALAFAPDGESLAVGTSAGLTRVFRIVQDATA
jgi:WD40 repeat protein